MASLGATSGDVLISLTHPVGGATVIGYRIYYNSGGSQSSRLMIVITETEFVLDLKGATLDDMMISIRAESAQLPSELVTVNVAAAVMESTTMEVLSTTTAEPLTTPATTEPATTTEPPTTTIESNLTEATTSQPIEGEQVIISYYVFGASPSEPHINGTALREWYIYIYRPRLLTPTFGVDN
jgi:hypothetical protein